MICLIVGVGFFSPPIAAQVNEEGIPESFFLNEKNAVILPSRLLKSLPDSLLNRAFSEIRTDNHYGIVQSCEIDIKKDGIRTELTGKGTIWRVKIQSENALSLGLFFRRYKLPQKAKVFVYDPSHLVLRGGFTNANNNQKNILPIAEFPGKELIIEYFEPQLPDFEGELQLGAVTQAFRNIRQDTGDRIGINCPEGSDWQKEKHSVCLITYHDFQNSYFCTGALINNTREDETPYFLTANHCVDSEEEASTLITYFNYENTSCSTDDAAFSQSLAGATFKAGNPHSDFSLLLLNEYPPDEYNPFYAGWDVSGANPRASACLHHPDGESKSIALANNTAFSYPEKIDWFSEDLRLISTTLPDTHWNVLFTQGMPEEGSSGGPLFDQNKRIVGQLHGGVNSVLLFGKLSVSWNFGEPSNQQLAYWLDPAGTKKTVIDGIWKMPPKANFRVELQEVCVDAPILFTDRSTHRPTEWLWQVDPPTYDFANGTDSTSQNPQIVFEKDGVYSIKLISTNRYGSDELIQKNYVVARSKLDVNFLKTKADSVVCGCDLKDFPFTAGGALKYSFEVERKDLIDIQVNENQLFLTMKESANYHQSFDTWVKVTGTNSHCMGKDSVLLHVIIQPNDNIANAAKLFLGRNSGFTNKCASAEVGEPYPLSSGCLVKKSWCPDFKQGKSLIDNSVWFSFIAPSDGKLTIDTQGFDTQIAVYDSPDYQSILSLDRRLFTMVAAADNRVFGGRAALLEDLELEPGKRYWLQVDGNNAAYGNFTIDLISQSLEAEVFPNPSSGVFTVNVFHPERGTADLTVSDLNGRILFSQQYEVSLNESLFRFNLNGFAKGVYIMHLHLNDRSLSKKLVHF
ncbi:MAG: T9SS type A sorting domain-containing protein [Prolixibacteraceae bacterium]|nr:T9SS type A sorting domain-containing protein [Prolixibacteraceae bacterium]